MKDTQRETVHTHSPVVELYHRYAPTIFLYLRTHLSSREDAEDILLDVFLAALESGIFADMPEKRQSAWLYQVARHKLADYYRRSSHRQTMTLEQVTETVYELDEMAPEQVALREEEYEQLRRKVALLSLEQQEVLRLRFAGQMRYAEIAMALGKSEGAIRMLLMRALNVLRDIYKR